MPAAAVQRARVCVRWEVEWVTGRVVPKETTGTALVSVAFRLPLGSKLDQGRKIHILLLQSGPLSLDRIRTVNHFGNTFQLIKILPDCDRSSEFSS